MAALTDLADLAEFADFVDLATWVVPAVLADEAAIEWRTAAIVIGLGAGAAGGATAAEALTWLAIRAAANTVAPAAVAQGRALWMGFGTVDS